MDPVGHTLPTPTRDPAQELNVGFQVKKSQVGHDPDDRDEADEQGVDDPFRDHVDQFVDVFDSDKDERPVQLDGRFSAEPKAVPGSSGGKPTRRAQIFDKGVDASRMQV